LIPIIGIGLYPKLVTQTYDVKTTEVAMHIHETMKVTNQERANLYASDNSSVVPQLPKDKRVGLITVNELDKFIILNQS
jgi:NAD(P)H-quinone oxidoreductase subunit 4